MNEAKKHLDDVYTALATTLDAVGCDHEALFLSKLALLLAHDLNDPDRVLQLIALAKNDLYVMGSPRT